MQIQLDFFKSREESELDMMRLELAKVAKSSEKVRRGTYANINELKKLVLDMGSRMEVIERHICSM